MNSRDQRRGILLALALSLGTGADLAQAQTGLQAPVEHLPASTVANRQAEKTPAPPTASMEPTAPADKPLPSFWETNPPVRIIPKLGNLPVFPSGPGYYSLLDWVQGEFRQAPPKFPYPRFAIMPFGDFDLDFRYLDSPTNQEHDWSDCLHRIHLGENWLFTTGGELRWMYQGYGNFNLSGKDDHKDLFRTRVYGDLWYRDNLRVFVEFLDARSFNQVLNPQVTDVDHADLLNAFVDVKVAEIADKPVYVRAGRQLVYFGSQRLVGQLDWVNTNRTFQGIRGFRQGEKFDVDAFFLQPVIPNATQFDWVDTNQYLAGVWTTYRPQKGHIIDFYDLVVNNGNNINKLGLNSGQYEVNTLGARYLGNKDETLLWDFEGMFQLGKQGGSHNIAAGAATTGLGWHWKDAAWNPTLWGYFDYASGDRNPNAGTYNTFNQLVPFGHYYLGWIDIVGRQNILDPNLQFFMYPTKWMTVWVQYHHFWLASAKDALYNAGGVAILRDPTGNAGTNVGDEFDFTLNFTLSKHSNLLVSYDVLNAGRFVRTTSKDPNASAFYVMYSFRW